MEDNEAMRALIRSLVEEITPEIRECDSAERALDLYGSWHPEWVLMDIALGGMDGITATREIRKLDPAARVVIVTEHGDARYRDAAAAAGACGFVLKENLLELSTMLGTPPRPTGGENAV